MRSSQAQLGAQSLGQSSSTAGDQSCDPICQCLGANSQKPNYNFVFKFSSTAVVPSFDEKTITDAKLSEAGTVAVDLGSGLIVYYNGGCAFKLEEGAVSSIFVN